MTLKQKLAKAEAEVRDLRECVRHYQSVAEIAQKRNNALREAITYVHPRDLAYMRQWEAANEDRALFDVFNSLIYAFGRPIEDGTVWTRLSCPSECRSAQAVLAGGTPQ
jgi:hypothetical protein